MTIDRDLSQVLQRHARVFSSALNVEADLLMFEDGDLVAMSHAEPVGLIPPGPALEVSPDSSGRARPWWQVAVPDDNDGVARELVLAVAAADGVDTTQAHSTLAAVAANLAIECAQTHTIQDLSIELGNRYEELNLLYGVEDNLKGLGSDSAEEAIRGLLESCLDLLDIEGAGLHLADHDINLELHETVSLSGEGLEAADEFAAIHSLVRVRGSTIILAGNPIEATLSSRR